MARVLFFALLAMCLVCLIQGAPAGEQPAETTAGTTAGNPALDEFLAKTQELGETIKTTVVKAVEDFNNNPHVKQLMDSGTKLAKEAADRFQTQIQAAIPKTEEIVTNE